jgi:hypothetical protein
MQESGTPHFLLNRSFTDIKQTQQTNSTNKLKSNQKEIKSWFRLAHPNVILKLV